MSNETKTNGGPAFPIHTPPAGGCGPYTEYGMTLRDYFAGKALGALFSHEDVRCDCIGLVAMQSYGMADAMLAEREKGGAE